MHESYAEVAAQLYGYELLSEAEARAVMLAAQTEGLAISNSDIDALIQGPEREVWRTLLFAVIGLLVLESAFMVWAGRKG